MAESPNWERELAKLAPETRKRVEAAMKEGLEAELAAEAGSFEARKAEFSRGWFFSRSKPVDFAEDEVMRKSMSLDDESFIKFANRLTELNSLKDTVQK